ncbi:MAG: hypothetical protein OHK0046_26380 [Anaerolineae bacterium]
MTELSPEQIAQIRELSKDEASFIRLMDILLEQQADCLRLQNALQDSKRALETTLEASNEGFWDWHVVTGVIYFSPRWKALFGFTDEDLDNTPEDLNKILFDEDREATWQLFNTFMESSERISTTTRRFRRKDGSTIYILSRLVAIRDEYNRLLHIIGSYSDVTELINAKNRAETADRAKSAFITNISHELRTPLNAILGFGQLLQRMPSLTETQAEYVDVILSSGEQLLTFINDLLEIARVETGMLEVQAVDFDLRALLNGLDMHFRLQAERQGLTFEMFCDPALPQIIHTDHVKLRHVLVNLLSNAIKFTTEGRVTVRVWDDVIMQEDEDDAHCLFFEVQDTGCGISSAQMEHLFVPFNVHAMQGAGLGLSISYEFVRRMGGQISVDSAVGEGSRFVVELPITPSLQRPAPAPQHITGLATEQRVYRMLVIDKRDMYRHTLVQMLCDVGFHVTTIKDGHLETLAQEYHPDMIWVHPDSLTDPNLVESLRALHTGQRPPLVIRLHGETPPPDQALYDDVLTWPYNEDDLFEKIMQHLGVRFTYQQTPTPDPGETIAALHQLPEAEVNALQRAAIHLDSAAALSVIEQIKHHNSALALTLTKWVEDFHFDKVLEILQQVPK